MYDEPFAGLDPISLGVDRPADPPAERRARHHVDRRHARRVRVARRSSTTCISCPTAGSSRRARRTRCARRPIRSCASSSTASPTARCRSTTRRTRYAEELELRADAHDVARIAAPASATRVARRVWRAGLRERASSLDAAAHSPARACGASSSSMREIYFAGVLSLVIIMVSGLFVGMVLGLQGYDTLQRYGADRVARRARRAVAGARTRARWSPALLFASRAGTAHHRRDRPDEGDRAAVGDGNDGGRSDRARRGAAVLGGVISMPLLAALFSRDRHLRRLARRRAADRRRRRRVLVADAGRGRFPRRHRERRHQERRVRHRGHVRSRCSKATKRSRRRKACRARRRAPS